MSERRHSVIWRSWRRSHCALSLGCPAVVRFHSPKTSAKYLDSYRTLGFTGDPILTAGSSDCVLNDSTLRTRSHYRGNEVL